MNTAQPLRPWQVPMPKEHGAWVMLATALAVGLLETPTGERGASSWLAAAALAAFLAREPAAVALGHRTARRKAIQGSMAGLQALVLAGLAALAGTWALLPLRTDTLIVLALLTAPGVVAAAAVVRGKEHTVLAELAAAVALALAGLLVQLCAPSQDLHSAWPPYLAWGCAFVALTLGVHLAKRRLLRIWPPVQVALANLVLELAIFAGFVASQAAGAGLTAVRTAVLAPWLVAVAGPLACALARRPKDMQAVGLAASALHFVALLAAYALS
ncbi:MAG: YwiC-like family protein [Deltaproteobacteria bacterium]|nr:YwiC-like family protein [Deltaproteobacteria bacterium]